MTNNAGTLNDKEFFSCRDVSRGDDLLTAQQVTLGDTPLTDAFGRLRVSNGVALFDSYEIDAKKTAIWAENTTGAASTVHVANQAAVQFTMSAANGDKNRRESKRLMTYTPGVSMEVLMSGVMGVGAANSSQRIGVFNKNNGIFFEQKDGDMGIVIRSYTTGSVSNNRIEQDDWSVDPFDGTGPSGVTLDFTKTQVFVIDFQWLGVGRVRCGFSHNGRTLVAHEFYHNNSLSKVYMSTPLLPVVYETENTAASTALTDFRQIACVVISEGSGVISHDQRSIGMGVTSKATTTTSMLPILSMRITTAYVGLAMVKPSNISVLTGSGVGGTRDQIFTVIHGGTLSSDSFSANSGIVSWDVAATHITGGVKLSQIYVSAADRVNASIFDHTYLLGQGSTVGVGEILTVAAQSIAGAAAAYCTIDYEEYY